MKFLLGFFNNVAVMRGLGIIWTVIILIGCLTPHAELPGEILTLSDKALHVAIFVPFGFLWARTGFQFSWVFVAGTLLGAFIELLQYMLPINRTGEWVDLAADVVGTLVGILISRAFDKVLVKQ
ncbi:hypothetical protein GCM10028807_19890 [Spirosoma daeguense]